MSSSLSAGVPSVSSLLLSLLRTDGVTCHEEEDRGRDRLRVGVASVDRVAMLDQWIQTLQAGDCLAERDLKKLCLMVRGVKSVRISISPLVVFFFFLPISSVSFSFLHRRITRTPTQDKEHRHFTKGTAIVQIWYHLAAAGAVLRTTVLDIAVIYSYLCHRGEHWC